MTSQINITDFFKNICPFDPNSTLLWIDYHMQLQSCRLAEACKLFQSLYVRYIY